MSPRLQGKVCIVTGAGAPGNGIGNGRAVAILFAREGGHVLVVDRDAAAATRTVEMITDEGGTASSFVGDLTDEETAARMVSEVTDRWGKLDVLHNNIGITSRGSVVETSRADWDRVLEVNVTSIMLASKYAIPVMAAGGGGSVINISSISAIRPRGMTAYTASKGAVIALTRAMAVDHGPAQIRVNCIAPGPLYTPHVTLQGMSEEDRDRRRRASLLQIEGTAWDVAHAAVYLASDESRYVTAVLLPIDGGASMGSPAR